MIISLVTETGCLELSWKTASVQSTKALPRVTSSGLSTRNTGGDEQKSIDGASESGEGKEMYLLIMAGKFL